MPGRMWTGAAVAIVLCLPRLATATGTTPAPEADPFVNIAVDLLEPGVYPVITVAFPCQVAGLSAGQFAAIKQDTFIHLTQVFDLVRDEIEIIDLVSIEGGTIGAAITFSLLLDPVLLSSLAEALEKSQIITSCGTSVGPGTLGARTVLGPPTAPPTTQPTSDPSSDPTSDPTSRPTANPSASSSTQPTNSAPNPATELTEQPSENRLS